MQKQKKRQETGTIKALIGIIHLGIHHCRQTDRQTCFESCPERCYKEAHRQTSALPCRLLPSTEQSYSALETSGPIRLTWLITNHKAILHKRGIKIVISQIYHSLLEKTLPHQIRAMRHRDTAGGLPASPLDADWCQRHQLEELGNGKAWCTSVAYRCCVGILMSFLVLKLPAALWHFSKNFGLNARIYFAIGFVPILHCILPKYWSVQPKY